MSVSLSLNNALTGLNVNQQALTVLSQNIANANTPGYSRQIVNQKAVTLDGVGEGVSIDSITRKVDDYLNRAVQVQNSTVGQASTLNDYYTKIQLLLGTPGNQNSVDSYINNFFNALQSLSQSPDNTALQKNAVNSGVTVATQINQLANGLVDLQFQADLDIKSGLSVVNNDLKNVHQLNKVIVQNIVLGKSVADLQDQRDNFIRDIASYMNVSTFQRPDGSLFLTAANGISILDESLYQFDYTPSTSSAVFSNNGTLTPLTVSPVDVSGTVIGTPVTVTTGDKVSNVKTLFSSGTLAALTNLRDQFVPNITEQIDTLTASLRDQVNAVHNSGSGYPGAGSLTGTRSVNASDYSEWSGKVKIALLDSNGQPIASPYTDEPYGLQPLTIDLSKMDTGAGSGSPSVQGIIDAVNQYYGVQHNKAEVGNLNNIQLVSDTTAVPNTSSNFTFDMNLNNISIDGSKIYVTSVTATDNLGVPLTTSSTAPTLNLDPFATYVTTAGSQFVSFTTTTPNNLSEGQVIFLSTPPAGPDGGTYDGIPASALGGYVTVTNVSTNGFQVKVGAPAITGGTYGVTSQIALPPYASVGAGETTRTTQNGKFSIDLAPSAAANYYNINVTVGVDDGSGVIKTSQISYQLFNQQPAILNSFLEPQSVTGGTGRLVVPATSAVLATAKLVDANGVELPKSNGKYTLLQNGYLKLESASGASYIAIDSLDSAELGKPNARPLVPGTNRGFSHYFDMNDFFSSNKPVQTGDTIAKSGQNLAVEQRIQNNNSLLSLGQLTQGANSSQPNTAPNYTYQLNPGDNSTVQRITSIASQGIALASAGGLGATTQTLSGYAGQIIGSIATNASNAKANSSNAQSLLDGFTQKASAISGVNLDTELANTVIYQNAYAASARVITVANTLFDDLLRSFG